MFIFLSWILEFIKKGLKQDLDLIDLSFVQDIE